MALLGHLFIFSPMKENEKFTTVFTRNIIEFSNVMTKETSQIIAADTVALTETANKFSQSLRGLIL